MTAIFLPTQTASPSPFQERVRNASPEQLTELVLAILGADGIPSSPTDWQGWVAVHSSGLDWELYCVVTNSHSAKPTIELTAVSDTWCESPKLYILVSSMLVKIGISLHRGLELPVLTAPVPRWF
jgi:hypothetical protein